MTPSVQNCSHTNRRFATLQDVVEALRYLKPVGLADQQKGNLIEYLKIIWVWLH
jgi:hypothetical protein